MLNPYTSPSAAETYQTSEWKPKVGLWAFTGACLFSLFPLYLGIIGFRSQEAWVESLPPDVIACSNTLLPAITCILFGVPFFAIIGAMVGFFAAKFVQSKRNGFRNA